MEAESIPQTQYRSKREYLSASDVKLILENPYLYKIGYQRESSDSMILGSVIHSLVLEPDNFDRDFEVIEPVNIRTKAGKEIMDKHRRDSSKTVVPLPFYEKAKKVAKSVLSSDIGNLFKNGIAENSYFGELYGVKCKCRPDYVLEASSKKVIIDLKTTKFGGASPDAFMRAIASYGYYIQAAFYLNLLQADDFIFVAVETDEPFMIGVYELDRVSLDFGESEIRRAIEIYQNLDKIDCVYKDSDFKKKQTLTLPNWVYYKKDSKI